MNSYWCGLAMPSIFPEREFVAAYQEAFSGAPYYETYTEEQVVEDVLRPHQRDGMIMYATHSGKLIGFGCALPFDKSPDDVKEFLERLHREEQLPAELDFRSAWYMSELGVLNAYRGLGAAWELVLHRMFSMSHRGARQYFMRTAAVGSNSAPMYIKCGAQMLPVLQDVPRKTIDETHTHSEQRMYLWGNCIESAARIRKIQDEKGYIPFSAEADGAAS